MHLWHTLEDEKRGNAEVLSLRAQRSNLCLFSSTGTRLLRRSAPHNDPSKSTWQTASLFAVRKFRTPREPRVLAKACARGRRSPRVHFLPSHGEQSESRPPFLRDNRGEAQLAARATV